MHTVSSAFVLILWIFTMVVYLTPLLVNSTADLLRNRNMNSGFTTLFVLLVVAMTMSVGNAIAQKGGGTNQPPVNPSAPVQQVGRITLYVVSPEGRLVPLGAKIKEYGQ